MADVYAVFGTLLALGIAFPGLLTAWWLLFPVQVDRARERLDRTPGRSFGMGLIVTGAMSFPVAILLALPSSLAKFIGAVMIVVVLAIASLGAAGLAAAMSGRVRTRSGRIKSDLSAFLAAALALELAAAFPVIGWFLVIPAAIVACLGATSFALLGWAPQPKPQSLPDAATQQA